MGREDKINTDDELEGIEDLTSLGQIIVDVQKVHRTLEIVMENVWKLAKEKVDTKEENEELRRHIKRMQNY